MAMNLGDGGSFNAEINVTPLVDVVLVLLIIFMIIVPLTMRGYDVAIPGQPEPGTTPPDANEEQVILEIGPETCPVVKLPATEGLPENCVVLVSEREVPVAELAGRVAEIFAGRTSAEPVLFLAADGRMNYEAVMRIVDIAKSRVEGLRIGMVTEGRLEPGVARRSA